MDFRTISAWTGVTLIWIYMLFIVAMNFSETCTMGGDGLTGVLIVGTPIGALSCVALLAAGSSSIRRTGALFALGPAALVSLAILVPPTWSVTILGHHYCGAMYDGYLQYLPSEERWMPLGLLSFVAVVVAISVRPYVQRNAA